MIETKIPEPLGKKAAHDHYDATVKSPEDYELLLVALDNYRKSDRVARGFVQNGSTWFNQWRDWVAMAPGPRRVEPGIHVGGAPVSPAREAVEGRITAFRNEHGSRPSRGPEQESWDVAFTNEFGFTPEQWIEGISDEHLEGYVVGRTA